MIPSRQKRITEIIHMRRPFLQDIERKEAELRRRSTALNALEELRMRILKNGSPSMISALQDIHLTDLQNKLRETLKELEKPKSRFSRETLNIGVIGRAGQGKSRLLQSLSGLTSEVIPTGSRGHCTGARNLIHNDITQQPRGEISFYSESDFIETIIQPYYDELGLEHPPTSLSEFAQHPLPPLPAYSPKLRRYAQAGEMYRHLQEYKNHLITYGAFIGSPKLPIPLREIREYVAQDDVKGEKKYYKYFAVREAEIICQFNHTDVGQVALVDMPGLGDTGAGAEERLIQALGESIDIVLFVLMPRPERGILADVDFGLYDLTYGALPGIPIDQWSFMVLNNTVPKRSSPPQSSSPNQIFQQTQPLEPILGDNLANCQLLQEQIKAGKAGGDTRKMQVVDTLIADCSDPTKAKEIVLDTVLNYLVQHISDLDRVYLSSWQTRLAVLQAEIDAELQKGLLFLNAASEQSQENLLFEQRFRELWGELTTVARDLRLKLEQEKDIPNPTFAAYFKDTFDKCRNDASLPTKQEILQEGASENALMNAFNHALNNMRTHLTHHFVGIDDKLRLTMNEVKEKVSEVFLKQGRLAELVKGNNTQDLFTTMAEEKTLSPQLRESFQVLAKYELSLRGFFQSRIRAAEHLDDVTPDKTKIRPELSTPEGVVKTLKELHRATVEKMEKTLKDWENEPSEAARATVEEFLDQSLYSKRARDAWRAFYHSHKTKIWPEDFEKSAQWDEFQREWQTLVKRAIVVNNAENLSTFRLS